VRGKHFSTQGAQSGAQGDAEKNADRQSTKSDGPCPTWPIRLERLWPPTMTAMKAAQYGR
jgi:hypothetical protein